MFFAQNILLHLAHRIAWQCIHKKDALGLLELRELIRQGIKDCGLVDPFADNHGDDALAKIRMRHTNNR